MTELLSDRITAVWNESAMNQQQLFVKCSTCADMLTVKSCTRCGGARFIPYVPPEPPAACTESGHRWVTAAIPPRGATLEPEAWEVEKMTNYQSARAIYSVTGSRSHPTYWGLKPENVFCADCGIKASEWKEETSA